MMVLKPEAELPAIKKGRESPSTLGSKDTPKDSSTSQGGLEDRFLENLEGIEAGLKPHVQDGRVSKAIVTDFGRIDLLAVDKNDNFVALQVRSGSVQHNDLLATFASVGWLKKSMRISSLVRVIIIAEAFDEKATFFAAAVPNMELIQYEIKPTIKRIRR